MIRSGPRSPLPWAVGVILLTTVGAYAPSLRGEFQFDDWTTIQTCWPLRSLGRFLDAYSITDLLGPARPVTDATFAVDYAIGGAAPLAYHLTSLAVHLAATLLAFRFVLGLLRRAGSPRAGPLALLVTAAFALHPLQTESICYASQRSEALASALYLGALLLLVRAYDARTARRAIGWAVAGTCVAALAIGAKTIAVTLPAAFLAWAVALGRREGEADPIGRRAGRALLLGSGAWALSAASIALNLLRLGPGQTAGLHAGELGPWRYLLTQLRVHWWYARLLAWPSGQTVDPAFAPSPSPPDAVTWGAALATAAVLAGAAWVLRRAERSAAPSPAARLVPFGAAWWYLLLAPTSSVVPIDDLAAEHRVYLALLGALLAIAAAIDAVAAGSRWPRRALAVAGGLGIAACVALAVALALRAQVWATQLSLWEDAAAKRPLSHRSIDNYGVTLQLAGRREEALRQHLSARALARTPWQVADSARNLALLYARLGLWERALTHAREGVAAVPEDWALRTIVAEALRGLGRRDEAFQEAKLAVRLGPQEPSAHNVLGVLLLDLGRPEAALAEFRRARAIDPDDRSYAENVFQALAAVGRRAEACAEWETSRRMAGAGDPKVAAAALELGCRP